MHTPSVRNILLYGTDTLSLAVLSRVHHLGYNLISVTKPNSPVHRYCKHHQIPVDLFNKSVLPFGRKKRDFAGYLGIVASFGHMIPSKVIRSMELGFVNIHPSLLPKYQGAAPLPHTLLNGDTEYGVTVLEALPRSFDRGKILRQTRISVPASISGSEFWDYTAQNMAENTGEFLERYEEHVACAKPQDHSSASPAPRISKEQLRFLSRVCPHVQTAEQIYNIVRCLDLYNMSVVCSWQDRTLKLKSVTLISDPHVRELARTRLRSGQFVLWEGTLVVKCAEDTVLGIKSMVLPFKPVITAQQFYKDHCNNRVEKVLRMVYSPSEWGFHHKQCGR